MPYKYPNIELKRCFDARNFRESNKQITRLASTRAGSMRSHVQTSIPRKYRKEANQRESGRHRTAANHRDEEGAAEESDSMY